MMGTVVVLAMAAPAAAQDVVYRFEKRGDAPVGPGAAGQADVFTLAVPPGSAGGLLEQRMGLLAVEPFEAAEPKTDAPYTADIVTDVVQTLADGNRIEHHTTSSVARDSLGRVRREQQLAAIGPVVPRIDRRMITIMNPVDGVHYTLDPARKVAMRSAMPVFKPGGGVAQTRIMIGGRLPRAGSRDALPGPGAGNVVTHDVDTLVTRRGADQGRSESLGTQVIEGVQSEGTRTVVTIPAGTIGNQAPIEIVSERWFSPELGVVVMSRRSDPRLGETTYRLQNIVRGEPSPELFQVPSHYSVEALPAFGAGHFVKPSIEP
jgi:hypothetical protein